MFGRFHPARRTGVRSFVSTLALSAAVVAATAATGSVAQAQTKRGQQQAAPKAQNSEGFAKVYQPLSAIANAPSGDYAAAKAQVPAMIAAIQTPDDRNLAGSLLIVLGTKLNDRALQRQGLELMVQSGRVAPDKIGQVQFFLGNLAFEAKDYPAALAALQAAKAANFADENLNPLLAEAYFAQNQVDPGLAALKAAIDAKRAAGGQVNDTWIRRGLQVAYDKKLTAQANEWSALLASTNPNAANWTTALQVVNAVNAFDPQVQLDLMRLMAATGSLKARNDYVRYIEAADPRVMSNEVAKVLQSAVSAGALATGDTYYGEVKRVVDQRSAADRADAPRLVAEASKAANGNAALNAADVLYSLGDYAQAEKMYQLALTKGGVDKDKALTRLGIAQSQQGKNAEAKATFAQVTGTRATVAQMWQAYVSTKA